LFRDVYALARDRYEEDRASYHVSANLEHAVSSEDAPDDELPDLLSRFHEREILHVTFGSVLGESRLRERLFGLLSANPGAYAAGLEDHFLRHLEPFGGEDVRV
jgi:tagaturonate epimerase